MKRAAIRMAAALVLAGVLLAGHGSGASAQPTATITLPAPGAARQLYPGCNNIGLTFPEGTASTTVAQAVTPAGALQSMWRHDAAFNRFEGFSPAAPQASDLLTVGFLDAVWLCIGGAAPAAQAPPPAVPPTTGPTSSLTAIVAPTDALGSFAYDLEMSLEVGGEFAFSIGAAGEFEAPDSFSCTISGQVPDEEVGAQVVVIGESAWGDTGNGLVPVSHGSPLLTDSIAACPGWSGFWEDAYLPASLPPGVPETVNGVAALRYPLAGEVGTPLWFGLLPPGMEGVTVNAYDVWLAEDGGWLVRFVEDVSMDFDESAEDVLLGRAVMRVDITNPNSPDIHIEPPAP
jgi:hypothetical protein